MQNTAPASNPARYSGSGLLRTQLFLLILFTLAPVFALGIYSYVQQRKTERAGVEAELRALAQLAATSQQSLLEEPHNVLSTWGQISFVANATNRDASHRQSYNLRMLAPDHANFGMIEKDGALFSNGVKSNYSLNLADRAFFQQAMHGKFSIGNYEPDPLAEEPVLNFGYPITNSTHVTKRVFFASLKLSLLTRVFFDVSLPVGGSLWMFDPAGNVLARYPDTERWVGQNLKGQPLFQRAAAGEKSFEDSTLDGTPRLYASAPVKNAADAAITVVAGIPRASSFAMADSSLRRNLLVMACITIAALIAANLLARRLIVRPVMAMVHAANRLAHGDLSARTGINDLANELGQLAHAFDGMAANLEARHKELETAAAEIQKINAGLEQRVRERTAQLESSNRELEAFSYSVSHDLRAPLRHISGFVGLLGLEESVSNNEKTMGYLTRISNAARQMGTLVDDLLSFSRMGRSAMMLMPVKLSSLAEETRAEIMRSAPDRNVEWRITPLPEVHADLTMIRQVFLNLFSNSVKYTGPRPLAVIEVGTLPHETEHVIFVRDNGVGFDMKYANKLFGVFQRLHLAEQFEGTGIGLANVQRIILRHRGRVWAEAQIDGGATFYFSLPKA